MFRSAQPVGAFTPSPFALVHYLFSLVCLEDTIGFVLTPPDKTDSDTLVNDCLALLEAAQGLRVLVLANCDSFIAQTSSPEIAHAFYIRMQVRVHREGKMHDWQIQPTP